MRKEKIIYSINVADVQNVAQQEMGRDLTDTELKIVEDKIGEEFDWFEAIAAVIEANINQDNSVKSNSIFPSHRLQALVT